MCSNAHVELHMGHFLICDFNLDLKVFLTIKRTHSFTSQLNPFTLFKYLFAAIRRMTNVNLSVNDVNEHKIIASLSVL